MWRICIWRKHFVTWGSFTLTLPEVNSKGWSCQHPDWHQFCEDFAWRETEESVCDVKVDNVSKIVLLSRSEVECICNRWYIFCSWERQHVLTSARSSADSGKWVCKHHVKISFRPFPITWNDYGIEVQKESDTSLSFPSTPFFFSLKSSGKILVLQWSNCLNKSCRCLEWLFGDEVSF